MNTEQIREALAELGRFPLLDALHGRRARRFALGGEIPRPSARPIEARTPSTSAAGTAADGQPPPGRRDQISTSSRTPALMCTERRTPSRV